MKKSEIAERIFEIIEKHPKYFAENQEVLSERELMIEGKTYRPDRMVKIDDAWFIIDFKTGNPSEKHQNKLIYTKKRWKIWAEKLVELN